MIKKERTTGDLLAELLENKHISKAEFGRMLGVSREHVYNILQGDSMTFTRAKQIAEILGVPANYFFGEATNVAIAAGGGNATVNNELTELKNENKQLREKIALLEREIETKSKLIALYERVQK